MGKVKVKLVTLGHLPVTFKKEQLLSWKTELFEVSSVIDEYPLNCDSDIEDWQYSDELLAGCLSDLPLEIESDFLIAITNVPLTGNWYSRRIAKNKIVFTFHEIKDILSYSDIPLQNVMYRLLYAYSLVFLRSGRKIPNYGEAQSFTHDETKGCLFDMNGIKTDLVTSCVSPIICSECEQELLKRKIPSNLIKTTKREIIKIRKPLYFRWMDFIKLHPIISIFVSSVFVVFLGVLGSVIASYIYSWITKAS